MLFGKAGWLTLKKCSGPVDVLDVLLPDEHIYIIYSITMLLRMMYLLEWMELNRNLSRNVFHLRHPAM